jgi:hypothetical protein
MRSRQSGSDATSEESVGPSELRWQTMLVLACYGALPMIESVDKSGRTAILWT